MSNITKERLFQVADELDSKGINPTLAAVRKGLGGGSFTTISEAMAEWKARKAAKEKPLNEPAPQAVAERLAELGGEIWAAALELANGRLAAERETLEKAKSQYEAEKAEAAELADQVAAELEDMKKRAAALEAAEIAARAEADNLRQEFTILKERVSTSESRTAEIVKRADDLNAELSRVHKQNSDLVRALAEAAKGKSGKGHNSQGNI